MSNIAEKWKAFCEWQHRPYQVAKKSEEHHCCRTCGEEFQGNYCPRCGQSSRIGRYSLKNALLLFLDVWGMGNRGMFRTLRDLILRPGYMIRDYVSGMQMAYFPPFKLFFLLTALSLLVDSGLNVKGEKAAETTTEQTDKESDAPAAKKESKKEADKKTTAKKELAEKSFEEVAGILEKRLKKFHKDYPNVYALAWLICISAFIYFFVRKSPNIPDLRFSEMIVAIIYTANMFSIYWIVLGFLCAPSEIYDALYLLPIIPLRQMTGFKWWRSILVVLVSYLYAFTLLLILLFVAYFLLDL